MEDKYEYHTIIPKSESNIMQGIEELSWQRKEMYLFKPFTKKHY
jgi:hypothetical protein